ncbi:transposase [Mycolicibacterium sp.]|uniref:transposase n=1 Tax=Mycolicibacterium sp. TaxID=2320850 RepID=UPI0037C5EE5E
MIGFATMDDHVHLLVEMDPQCGLHQSVNAVKGCSPRALRGEFTQLKSKLPAWWLNSYFFAEISGAPSSVSAPSVETAKDR